MPPEQRVRKVEMITKKNEKYICTMPDLEEEDNKQANEYHGPNPYQLLKPLYDQKLTKLAIKFM